MGGFWMSDLAPCDEDIRNQVLRGTHMIFTRGTSGVEGVELSRHVKSGN